MIDLILIGIILSLCWLAFSEYKLWIVRMQIVPQIQGDAGKILIIHNGSMCSLVLVCGMVLLLLNPIGFLHVTIVFQASLPIEWP